MRGTRSGFHDELRRLEAVMLGGLELCGSQLGRALEAVSENDAELAGTVVAADREVDRCYREVHRGVLELLARQAPVAGDLRLLAALLHTIRCVERIGDQCANVAKLVALFSPQAPQDGVILDAIGRMGQLARAQVTQAREAFGDRDLSLARELASDELKITRLSREIFTRAVDVSGRAATREWAMLMILIARCLERIAGNAVDIGEQVRYLITGHLGAISPDREI